MNLHNKIVLITGSSRGIGRATAKAFAAKGARVVIHYNTKKEEAEKTVKDCHAELCVQADLSELEECKKLVEKVVEKFGRIDVLVNNAGTSIPAEAAVSLEKRWETIVNVNLRAPFFLAQHAKEHMPAGSAIINVASIRAFKPKKVAQALSIYGITKAGLVYLTKSLALELAPDIRVNAVAPGYVQTEMLEKFYKGRFDELIEETLLNRLIQPHEIAAAIVFLAENDAITGHTLVVDCGYLVR